MSRGAAWGMGDPWDRGLQRNSVRPPTARVIAWSPRTVEIVTVVADSLRAASVVTDAELQQGMMLREEFE